MNTIEDQIKERVCILLKDSLKEEIFNVIISSEYRWDVTKDYEYLIWDSIIDIYGMIKFFVKEFDI